MLAPDPRFAVIDGLNGKEFELALVELFEGLGYDDVERIGGFDKGADLILTDGAERVAVQAKRSSSAVGIAAVRQLLDGRSRYGCTRALLVTNNYFTAQATECAQFYDITLWDRRKLAEFLDGESPEIDTSVCADCGVMISPGVREWCLRYPQRYGGAVYCMKHQRRFRRSRATSLSA
jgi:hypothetical protein